MMQRLELACPKGGQLILYEVHLTGSSPYFTAEGYIAQWPHPEGSVYHFTHGEQQVKVASCQDIHQGIYLYPNDSGQLGKLSEPVLFKVL